MSEVLCRCNACSAKFKVDVKYAGKKARCPKCSVIVEVPAPGNSPVSGNTTVIPPAAQTTVAPPKVAPPPSKNDQFPPGQGPNQPAPAHASSGSIPTIKTTTVAKPLPSNRPVQPMPVQPVPAREEAVNALIEEPVQAPAPIAATPPADLGFQLNVAAKPKVSSSSTLAANPSGHAASPTPRGKKKEGSALPLIIGGVVCLLLLVGGGLAAVVMMNSGGTPVAKGTKGGKGAAAAKSTGKLVIDWAEDERKAGGAVLINSKREIMLSKGELYFDLTAGEHDLLLQRRGYEQIETKITITKGETTTYKPEWKKNEFGSGGPTIATKTAGSGNSGGTDFQVGLGAGSPVTGFDGFTQNFHLAKEAALKQQKGILIVFGSSDNDSQTKTIGRLTQEQAMKDQITAAYVLVMIDFPRTREGLNNVFDSGQNSALAKEFGLRQLPTLALLDHKGKTYYLQTEWKKGSDDLKAYLEEGEAQRVERDKMWADIKGETLEPAVKMAEWLIEKKIVARYKEEVESWMRVANRLDPTNEKGQLESFVEADLMVKAVDIDPDDNIEVTQFVAPLQDWLTTKKFQNDDRGARMHILAAGLLGRADRRDEAMQHLARAATYSPKDAKLREALASAKELIERGNILSSGTGFLVSDTGYIMTNHHVIEGKGKVVVRLPGGKTTIDATVIAKDAERDMAILKVTLPADTTIKPIPVTPAGVGRGMSVAAFGFPLGDALGTDLKLTAGGVSALPGASNDQMITLDLRVNPGNSGGPLCDQKGNVVGMVTAKTGGNVFAGVDSYGLAIPSVDLIAFLDKHLPTGTARPEVKAGADLANWSAVDGVVSPGVLMILKVE
ncbi:trypsin-like peptidase domain-containing protein [Anatilimnocola sp. NA78]|uniref:trypsin-like peptidase domain-containing protein n=1 Tax=Anatilimnocola sp. NA78 TaxID=3415683 RepID=UPI003CE552D6